jgi:hypothetical protein
MEAVKVLVKKGKTAVVTCPSCRRTRTMQVAPYRAKGKRNIRARCSCSSIFSVVLEYRLFPRKEVKLLGEAVNLSHHKQTRAMTIKNLSMGGIGFSPFEKHRMQKDDRLQLSFVLNNSQNTTIETDVIVRNAGRDYVGCEFSNIDNFRAPLGFYLLS